MKRWQWQTVEGRRQLLGELVHWESVSLTSGEKEFPQKLQKKLSQLPYFVEHPEFLKLHPVDRGRQFLTAFYQASTTTRTIVLISHFDTVGIDDYGKWKPLATDVETLTKQLSQESDQFPEAIRQDILNGEYIFGRGTMDMKMGLVLHMALIEKASTEQWPINLILVAVPDEEVNSAGMRCATEVLVEMQNVYNLELKLFLNSEPIFEQESSGSKQREQIIYTGTMGKSLFGCIAFGKVTHAGEPFSGITSNYMMSFFTQAIEWNEALCDTKLGTSTPPPVNLQQKDLQSGYSVQTPFQSYGLYNVFMLSQNLDTVFGLFQEQAELAAQRCNEEYQRKREHYRFNQDFRVQVITFAELKKYAEKRIGNAILQDLKESILKQPGLDERDQCITYANLVMSYCQELAPAYVIFIAPPYYPAVNSSDDPMIKRILSYSKEFTEKELHLPTKEVRYFNGLCDLSYVNYQGEGASATVFEENVPVSETYRLPFEAMSALRAPVLNIGPYGKDAHKMSERLHLKSAFEEVPQLLEEIILGIANHKFEKS